MDADRIGLPSDSIGISVADTAASPRITAEQLLTLGERQMAYVRTGVHAGEPIFVLYGANGAPIVMIERHEQVAQAAMHLGFELSAVH